MLSALNTSAVFKTEVINRHGAFKTLAEVEFALMAWADWYNNARLPLDETREHPHTAPWRNGG
ncbi:hypothetical protein C8259_34345 [Nocardia nova]|jgi:hypothetical protein|uniref:Integrase catalytic domain-containing protein n=1 Tax=Nocardia nova TaxID=37330 RepID=A0A2T2YQ03_9NOCA|nr:hypothetical protein C8259_34345 [Nocardia nova]